jgi:hypothetical protein
MTTDAIRVKQSLPKKLLDANCKIEKVHPQVTQRLIL